MTDGSMVLALLRLLVSLGVVLTLLVMLARWARRRGVGGGVGARPGVEIELLSRRALSRGSALHVVRVGEQVLVLGVTDQQVSVLRELDPEPLAAAEPVEPAAGDPSEDLPTGPDRDFASVLATRTDAAAGATPLSLVPATRAERRALEGSHAPRLRLKGAPTGSAPVPTGWPWSAASVVVGALKGGRA